MIAAAHHEDLLVHQRAEVVWALVLTGALSLVLVLAG
jgi:hypothetical protein